MIEPKVFKKIAIFTDIHFGRRNNSKVHNQDCIDFITWFCKQVKLSKDYSHIAFLGDWFESRSAINIETLEYSYLGLKMLNDIGLPIYFIVGNHDLHRRTTRDVHSVRMFNELKNIKVVEDVLIEDNILFSPFLFEEEYKKLIEHNDKWAWLGHFEFKNFILTGNTRVMEHGPDPKLFGGPKQIMSGHFHKRQTQNNITYIGNVFPMDFGDAGDYERGMASYYVQENKLTFTNWKDCPKYYKTKLSSVLQGKWTPLPKMKVKCVIDVDLGYQDAQDLRDAMVAEHHLRDFILEEDRATKQGMLEGETVKVTEGMLDFTTIDDLVISQLEACKSDKKMTVESDLLVDIYKNLKIESETEVDQT